MILRWAVAAYLEKERHFRRVTRHGFLWMRAAVLREEKPASESITATTDQIAERERETMDSGAAQVHLSSLAA